MTKKEKIELAISLAMVGFYVYYLMKADGSNTFAYKLKWHIEQEKRRKEYERQFQHALNLVHYQAWEIVSEAPGGTV